MAELKRFLRRKRVEEITGLGESSIYAEMAKGTFPRPVKISANRVGWLEDEVAAWQAERLRSAREGCRLVRRPIIRATPAALRRAMAMFAPLDRPVPPIAERKPDARQHLDLADREPVERKESRLQK